MNDPQEREGEKKLGEIPGGEEAGKMVPEKWENARQAALWFKILIGLYIGLPVSAIGGPFIAVVAFGVLVVALATLVLGVLTLIDCKKSKEPLQNKHFIAPVMVMPVLIFLVLFLSLGSIRISGYGNFRLNQLHYAFSQYAEKNNGQWPEVNKWCDIIKKEDEDYEGIFHDEFAVAMNLEAAPLGNTMPSDMVLLFPSRPGLNQAGGEELVTEKTERGRIYVLLGDGKIKPVKRKDIPYLRWRLEDDGIIPVRDNTMPFAAVISILSLAVIGLLVSQRRHLAKHWIFAVGLGIASAAAGGLLGQWAENLYIKEKASGLGGLGGLAGIVAGFVVGVCFVTWLSRLRNRTERQSSIVGSGTLAGAVAGIVCSSIVHLLLMIHHEESNPANLLAGMSFGVWAGLVLSWVSCGIMDRRYKPKEGEAEGIQLGGNL